MLAAILKPRPLGAGAVVAFAVGVGLLYAGFSSLGPMVMLAGILLVILAAIAWTTPEQQVVGARLALTRSSTADATPPRRRARVYAAPTPMRRVARVYDVPGEDDPRINANTNE